MLTNAATEIGEFQVQLALGKTEAADEFERLKKVLANEFSERGSLFRLGKRQYVKLAQHFDELRLQLALGKAETLDLYNEQKKAINGAMVNLANEIGLYASDDPFRNAVRTEIEKTRIKLELLRLHYKFSEMTKTETEKKVEELKERAKHIRDHAELDEKVRSLEWEIETAYKKLKDSFI